MQSRNGTRATIKIYKDVVIAKAAGKPDKKGVGRGGGGGVSLVVDQGPMAKGTPFLVNRMYIIHYHNCRTMNSVI